MHWTHVERGHYAIFGEIDFAIVGPTGKVLLIEQKSGLLSETPGGLTKSYPGKEKNVASQMARSELGPSTGRMVFEYDQVNCCPQMRRP